MEKAIQVKSYLASVKENTRKAMTENAGQQASDNMGWIAVILVVIGVIIAFSIPALKNTILPKLQEVFMQIFSYHG